MGDWLQPNSLPNARIGQIENPFRFARLFATRLISFGGIGDADNNFLFAVPAQLLRDVERKPPVPAMVLARFAAVHQNFALPVHSPELKANAPAFPTGRDS